MGVLACACSLTACFSGEASRSYVAGGDQRCGDPRVIFTQDGTPEPRVAVVLLDGAGSTGQAGDFYPLPPVGTDAASGVSVVSNYGPVNS